MHVLIPRDAFKSSSTRSAGRVLRLSWSQSWTGVFLSAGWAGEAAAAGQSHPRSLRQRQDRQERQLFPIRKTLLQGDIWRVSLAVRACDSSLVFSVFQGKFIRINFDVNGYIVGANIETCIFMS